MTSGARALRPSGMYIVARERAGELTSMRAERAARWWKGLRGKISRSVDGARLVWANADDVWRGWWLIRSTTLDCGMLLHASAAAQRRGSYESLGVGRSGRVGSGPTYLPTSVHESLFPRCRV